MKRDIHWIIYGMLFLSITAVASAGERGACSAVALAGDWGYTETGWVIPPTGAVPAAAVGRYSFDTAGNFQGTQFSSAGGTVNQDTKKGTYTANSDCTGTLSLSVYDGSGNLLRSSVWAIVLTDNGEEIRGIMTSLLLPNGNKLPPVMTMTARRSYKGHGTDREMDH